jgi:hypothetical protein
MAVKYPFTVPTFTNPADLDWIRDIDFNRITLAINEIESALGVNVCDGSSAPNLTSRLLNCIATSDGMQKGGLLCEDDPSGAKRGTRRWITNATLTASWSAGAREFVQPNPYCIFRDDDGPFAIGTTETALNNDSTARKTMLNRAQTCSRDLVRWQFGTADDGDPATSPITYKVHTIVIGDFEIFEDQAPYMWRVDTVGRGPATH